MLSLGEMSQRMEKLKDWALENNVIVKEFSFKDFKEAMVFVNKIAELAEKEEHHPDILISYNIVRVSLTTHSEHGLTGKDFDVAEKIDVIT